MKLNTEAYSGSYNPIKTEEDGLEIQERDEEISEASIYLPAK